jgi:hypothetical protein
MGRCVPYSEFASGLKIAKALQEKHCEFVLYDEFDLSHERKVCHFFVFSPSSFVTCSFDFLFVVQLQLQINFIDDWFHSDTSALDPSIQPAASAEWQRWERSVSVIGGNSHDSDPRSDKIETQTESQTSTVADSLSTPLPEDSEPMETLPVELSDAAVVPEAVIPANPEISNEFNVEHAVAWIQNELGDAEFKLFKQQSARFRKGATTIEAYHQYLCANFSLEALQQTVLPALTELLSAGNPLSSQLTAYHQLHLNPKSDTKQDVVHAYLDAEVSLPTQIQVEIDTTPTLPVQDAHAQVDAVEVEPDVAAALTSCEANTITESEPVLPEHDIVQSAHEPELKETPIMKPVEPAVDLTALTVDELVKSAPPCVVFFCAVSVLFKVFMLDCLYHQFRQKTVSFFSGQLTATEFVPVFVETFSDAVRGDTHSFVMSGFSGAITDPELRAAFLDEYVRNLFVCCFFSLFCSNLTFCCSCKW